MGCAGVALTEARGGGFCETRGLTVGLAETATLLDAGGAVDVAGSGRGKFPPATVSAARALGSGSGVGRGREKNQVSAITLGIAAATTSQLRVRDFVGLFEMALENVARVGSTV